MAEDQRFLIGKGEELSSTVVITRAVKDKIHPYTFEEAKTYLTPRIRRTVKALNELPDVACPRDEAVAILTVHPSYLAKSYFPEELLGGVGLRAVGSRAKSIRPRKGTSRQQDRDITTVEIYAAGKRSRFALWGDELPKWTDIRTGALELKFIETVYAEKAASKLRALVESAEPRELFEAVLHSSPGEDYVVDAFERYVRTIQGKPLLDDRQQVGGLCYIPVYVDPDAAEALAEFSYLRGIRAMPRMRSFTPFRSAIPRFSIKLPTVDVINPYIRVAVLDGGLPSKPNLSHWTQVADATGVGAPAPQGLNHGIAVTSALLFGPLVDGTSPGKPYTMVDHYRVADVDDKGPNYYRILDRIVDVLVNNHYDYINISLGPDVTLDEELLHVWTAKLDALLSHGKTLAFFAAGNCGARSKPDSNRLGPPADAVNAIGVGSCDTSSEQWARATYSSIGPGRCPGVVKPDVVAFGGEKDFEEFGVLQHGFPLTAAGNYGTSFASPLALRTALGAAAHFGHSLHPLAVKALLIHHAHRTRHHSMKEVGWGRIPSEYEDLVTCEPDAAHIVYQGVLKAGKYLRAPIAVPEVFGKGSVYISATICYATETEPENTVSYTRAGLEVHFRPHSDRRKDPAQRHADTGSFFKARDLIQAEGNLRDDAMKWETSLKKTRRFDDPSSLKDPAFDIHYVARNGGGAAKNPADIPYAMIVTVRQKGFVQLYDRIVDRYRGTLAPLVPAVRIPIRLAPGQT